MSALGQKQTCAVQLGMSALGQKRKWLALFDHLIGPGEQRFGTHSGGGWHLCALAVSSHVTSEFEYGQGHREVV